MAAITTNTKDRIREEELDTVKMSRKVVQEKPIGEVLMPMLSN